MQRRALLLGLLHLPLLGLAGSAAAGSKGLGRLNQLASHWKPLRSPAAYDVLFEEDTERAHSSPLDREKRPGQFVCAACFQPLFDAAHKFDSGTGWPSFWQPLPAAVEIKTDFKLIYPRKEYHCSRCGGHQGHVFEDGPKPTGLRYCNNGIALRFVPAGEPLPALRS